MKRSQPITVGLTARVHGELADLHETTGLSKADLINRAVSLYAFVEEQKRIGRDLATVDQAAGVTYLYEISS